MTLTDWLVDTSNLTPHGFCLTWEPALLWLSVAADATIALAYFSIPLAVVCFLRYRKDVPHRWMPAMFALFIVACGSGHVMEIVTLWVAAYNAEVALKLLTAAISIVTAASLWPLVPKLLALPSPAQLEKANQALQLAQVALIDQNRELDHRVSERTEQFAEKSRLLEATLENMSQGIMMIDANQRVIVYNQQVMLKLGLPADLMATLPSVDDILHWQHQQGELNPETEDFETWRRASPPIFLERDGTYECVRPDGPILEVRSTPLRDGGSVRTYTDITERKHIEMVLRKARDEAHHAAQVKSEFLAMMSHEIRSPLNGLLGIIELLHESRLEGEPGDMVDLAHTSATALLGIVNEVLDFSKLEAGASAAVVEPTPLATLMQSLVDGCAHEASRKKLRIGCVLADDLPAWIEADPLRLRQIIGNLLSNALKFTAAGAVELNVSKRAEPDGTMTLLCAVSDTGMGMSADVTDRLFEPFMQADASTTKNFGGTGLGLSISRCLARMLGGDLHVVSHAGSGSTFTLNIPLVASAPVAVPAETALPNPDRNLLMSLRVLVAEDQEINRWLLRRQLARFGVNFQVVEDGNQALEALNGETFDLLVTDCHMPGLEGVELTQHIRASEAARGARRMPILGLTADVTTEMRERCIGAGMDDVVSKPINLSRLEQALCKLLTRPEDNGDVPAGHAEASAATLFDDGTYHEIFGDDDAEGAEWLEMFISVAAALNGHVRSAIVAEDRKDLKQQAHRLAGIALSAGAMRLGMLARSLETSAPDAAWPALRALEQEILLTYAATGDRIREQFTVRGDLVS